MTKKERVTVDFDSESYYLDGEYWTSWETIGEEMADKINDLLNEQEEIINNLKSTNMEMEDYIGRLEKQLISIIDQFNYIQNSIADKIKNQKTKIGEKVLREVIEDYNEWMLGHKGVKK